MGGYGGRVGCVGLQAEHMGLQGDRRAHVGKPASACTLQKVRDIRLKFCSSGIASSSTCTMTSLRA